MVGEARRTDFVPQRLLFTETLQRSDGSKWALVFYQDRRDPTVVRSKPNPASALETKNGQQEKSSEKSPEKANEEAPQKAPETSIRANKDSKSEVTATETKKEAAVVTYGLAPKDFLTEAPKYFVARGFLALCLCVYVFGR